MTTATSTPMRIGRVTLTVHDLDKVTTFYRDALGLQVIASSGNVAELGAGGTVFLELRQDRTARQRSPREAGLFHTAFLLPTRADLGRWTRHAAEKRLPVVGASDHLVSEAIYLSDPEGNGVEIYSDRPSSEWGWKDGTVTMATEALDVPSLVAAGGDAPWLGAPAGSTVGHVHLQVGAIPQAEAFYHGDLGFDVTCHYPGGTFYSSGGYHHHLATNVWNSRGATVREMPSTGLSNVEILAKPDALAVLQARLPALALKDPWGTPVTFAPEA